VAAQLCGTQSSNLHKTCEERLLQQRGGYLPPPHPCLVCFYSSILPSAEEYDAVSQYGADLGFALDIHERRRPITVTNFVKTSIGIQIGYMCLSSRPAGRQARSSSLPHGWEICPDLILLLRAVSILIDGSTAVATSIVPGVGHLLPSEIIQYGN